MSSGDEVTAPAATRTWAGPRGTRPCADLHDALTVWADPRTVRAAPGNTPARCYDSASWHGHQVDANIVSGAVGTAAIFVRLAG